MERLYEVAKTLMVLGLIGMGVGMICMLGAFLMQCPWPLVVGASATTVVMGVVIGKKFEWL